MQMPMIACASGVALNNVCFQATRAIRGRSAHCREVTKGVGTIVAWKNARSMDG